MTTRAKLKCISIIETFVRFECVYDTANKSEDNSFSKFTPFGQAQFAITNEDVLKSIKEGEFYYFDISPVQES